MTIKTLTPINLSVNISGVGSFSGRTSPVSVVGFRYSLKLNNIAEATISLGARSAAGIERISSLFPSGSGRATYFSEATVTLISESTSLSTIQQDGPIFTGFIVGYGNVNRVGDVAIELNLKGSFFRLQQIPLIAPGVHPTVPYSFDMGPLTIAPRGDAEQNFVRKLSNAIGGNPDGFDMFTSFVETYESLIQTFSASGFGASSVLEAAISAFGLGTSNSVLSQELSNFQKASNTSLSFSASVERSIQHIQDNMFQNFLSNPTWTWWDFLMALMQNFSLNVVSLGKEIVGIVKSPLDEPAPQNIIEVSRLNSQQLNDFPFFLPTRAVITAYTDAYQPQNIRPNTIIGSFPSSDDPTGQESATGVFTIFEQAPIFFGALTLDRASKRTIANSNNFQFRKVGSEVLSQVRNLVSIVSSIPNEVQDLANLYAQYILMHNRFRQRIGRATLRYSPGIVPGLPGRIVDPIGPGTFDCQIIEVNHSLDSILEQAVTEIVFDNIRYGGELSPNPFPNPLYSNFSVTNAASTISSILGVS